MFGLNNIKMAVLTWIVIVVFPVAVAAEPGASIATRQVDVKPGNFVHGEAALGHDLNGLLNYASEHNPELAATGFEADAAQQRTESAGALADPVLRTELMDITNQGTNKPPGLLPSQIGATRYLLMQSVPWFGKRDLQRDVASAQADQARGQTATTWSDLAGRIKSSYAMAYYLVASEHLTDENIALLGSLEQIIRTRYANGLGAQQDVIQVQLETTRLRSELIALQNEHHHAHVKLNSLLSRPANAPLAEPMQLRPLPTAAQLDPMRLQERLRAHNPQLRIAEAQLNAADKSRDLAYANRYPNFTLGVAPTQSGNTVKTWDLMVELNIPLQQTSRRSQEHEAESMRAAADARMRALQDGVEASLSESLSALESARSTEALVSRQLLPQSELTLKSAIAGYETGRVDFSTLITAQRQILLAHQQQLKAQLDAQLQLAEIEKLLGEEL